MCKRETRVDFPISIEDWRKKANALLRRRHLRRWRRSGSALLLLALARRLLLGIGIDKKDVSQGLTCLSPWGMDGMKEHRESPGMSSSSPLSLLPLSPTSNRTLPL